VSRPMMPNDPAYWMLTTGPVSKPKIFKPGCYICEDPEFAQMGLPLCSPCPMCNGHVPADDEDCDDCGESLRDLLENPQGELSARSIIRRVG